MNQRTDALLEHGFKGFFQTPMHSDDPEWFDRSGSQVFAWVCGAAAALGVNPGSIPDLMEDMVNIYIGYEQKLVE